LSRKLDSIFSPFNKSTLGVAVIVLQNRKVLAKEAYDLTCLKFCVAFFIVLLCVCLIQKGA
jgi:hypothetical protein